MDTDSESASRLQVILKEIQPRDTNNYFNQAKILKECDSFDLEDLNISVSNIDTSAEIKGKEGKTCDVTAQMVLVCCWRSMKEVALLLGTLCQLLPMQSMPESSDGLLTEDQSHSQLNGTGDTQLPQMVHDHLQANVNWAQLVTQLCYFGNSRNPRDCASSPGL
ncbi:tRNA (32-2'-O)-methyltransferase regulator THADA-like [Urocitellus parryii]